MLIAVNRVQLLELGVTYPVALGLVPPSLANFDQVL